MPQWRLEKKTLNSVMVTHLYTSWLQKKRRGQSGCPKIGYPQEFKKSFSGWHWRHQPAVNPPSPTQQIPETSWKWSPVFMGNHSIPSGNQTWPAGKWTICRWVSVIVTMLPNPPKWGANRWSVPSWWQPWVPADFGSRRAGPIASSEPWTGMGITDGVWGSKLGEHCMVRMYK